MTSERRTLIAFALALLGLSVSCAEREPGIQVELSMLHQMGSEPQFDSVRNGSGIERGVVTDLDYGVALSRIQLVIGRVELVPCETLGARWLGPATWDELLRFVRPVGVAHAHGRASPLALSAPRVLDLMGEDRATFSYGQLAPPPDRYCALRVIVEPADADAEGLAEEGLVGRSLWLEGSFIAAADPRARPLALDSALSDSIDVPFVDARGAPRELELSASERQAELRIELSYGHLLDGIDLRFDAPEQQQYLAIHNLLRSLRVVVAE
jgi:hypothetical protein